MNTRQQLLAVALFVVVLLPLGLAGVGGSAGYGVIELVVWLGVVTVLLVALFTWGRGPRHDKDPQVKDPGRKGQR